MEKKELKKFINDNGFFVQLDNIERVTFDTLEGVVENANIVKTGKKIPQGENIITFHGRASQKFGVGEQSRNEYKVDPKAWVVDNYQLNPQILLQHDDNSPIGKAVEVSISPKGLDVLYFVDLKTMSDVDAYKVDNGFYSALSTGHITEDYLFEHKENGSRITPEEFYNGEYLWKDYIKVISLAELVEISVVALGSNPKTLTIKNALSNFFTNEKMKHKTNDADAENAEADKSDENTDTKDEATSASEGTEEKEGTEGKEEGKDSVKSKNDAENAEGEEKTEEGKEDANESGDGSNAENAEDEETNKVNVMDAEATKKLLDAIMLVAEGVDALNKRVAAVENNQSSQPTKQPIATLNKVREQQAQNNPIAKAIKHGSWRG